MPSASLSSGAVGAALVCGSAAVPGPSSSDRLQELELLLGQLPGFAYRSRRAESWFLEYVSAGVLAVTGYTVEDLTVLRSQSTATIMDPADQTWFWPALQAALDAAQPYAFEYRIRTAAGETRWLLDKGQGLYSDGSLVGASGFATDITDRKRTEDALRASRDELAALFESSQDAIFIADAETGMIVDANPAAARLMALPKERLIGMHQSELHPPDTAERARSVFHEHVSGILPNADLDVLTGDGRRISVCVVGCASALRHGRRVVQGTFHDLTARRQAEQEAADLRQLMAVALANGQANMAIVAADLTVRYVDPVWRLAHGAAGGQAWEEFFAWRGLPWAKEQVREVFAEPRPLALDYALPGSDGRVIEVNVLPFASATGELLVAQFETDVTQSRRAAQALRDSERRYRLLFELESDGIVLMDTPACHILDANQAAERLLGYSRTELLTMRSHDLSAEPEATERTIQTRAGHVPLRHARHKDGTVFPVEVTLSYFEDGARQLCLAAIRDITARITAENALRESARRLDALLNNLPGCAFRIGGETLDTVEYVSDGVAALTGYPAAALIGAPERSYRSLIDPADAERLASEVGTAHAARQPYVIEFRIRTATGEERWLWAKGCGVYDGETLVASEGFATDISERRRAEAAQAALQAQLIQGQKMELVGRLAGGVAHDFNNLLTVILGCSSMAIEETQEPQTLADLRQIHKAGERARGLTRQLLAFGRKQVLDLRPTTLNRLILDYVDMLKRLIGEDIAIVTALQPDPWEVSVDAAQMVQVLMNLAANARDAMPSGGALALRTANLPVSAGAAVVLPGLRPGPHVMLEVTDTGCGMDSETQKHLFEPFFTTKRVGEGTGLGLATIQGIVEQHGGRIVCQSSPGQGTAFRLYLPCTGAFAVEPALPAASPSPALGGSETILLVEDDLAVLKMTEICLTRYGYQVVSTAVPAEALRLAATMAPLDLLLTDVIMPGMNGLELHAHIAALKPGIKVLYMSGYPGEVLSDRGQLEAGIRLVPKPFTAANLAASVREALAAEA